VFSKSKILIQLNRNRFYFL